MKRAPVLLLALSLSTPAWPQAKPVKINAPVNPAPEAPAARTLPTKFLKSLDVHLEQASLRLAPSPFAAAEYLSKASLEACEARAEPSVQAQAAKVAAVALAGPEARESVARTLEKLGGREGKRLSEKLRGLGEKAQELPLMRQLGQDLSRELPAGELSRLFDGFGAFQEGEFVEYAARRFMGGRMLAGGKAAVAYANIPEDQEMYDEVALSPLTNAERERVVVELFRQAGAGADEIVLQDAGKGANNVLVVKKGRTDRVVVVGAHHDKGRAGRGTIDNWTGATMAINLYQALRDVATEATYVFAAFAREEEGLLGSKEYVKRLTPEEKAKTDSMLNLDTLAADGTFSWSNNSAKALLERVKKVAEAAKLALKEMRLWGGDSDSSTFRRAGIPAMTLLGASNDVIWDIVHSERDNIQAFSLAHYKNAYLLSLELLKSLDVEPIGRAPLAPGA